MLYNLRTLLYFRNFTIRLLPPSKQVQQTEVVLLQGGGISQRHQIDLPQEYYGWLDNEPASKATIQVGSRGEFYARVATPEEVYMFEVRHVYFRLTLFIASIIL